MNDKEKEIKETEVNAEIKEISTPQSSFSKHFESANREKELYEFWEKSGVFKNKGQAKLARTGACKSKSGDQTFNIAMPPPNANGELHLGHAFGYTVMDILGRYHRLTGKETLLIPGKDHAGIQTQVVFEKKLKAEGRDHTKIPKEDLYKECYDFCIDRANYMRNQEKQMGLSADWEKEIFTLDPRVNKVVYETFKKLYDDGLVYKGSRIINWSIFSQTGISDVEVEYAEKDGNLWYLAYPLAEACKNKAKGFDFVLPNGTSVKVGAEFIIVATTRPETLLGDTAITVNPEDERYAGLIGSTVVVPFVNREIKIIADKRVDAEFGTGAVKVTPAHDFNDYEIGCDHKLEMIQVIGKDGKMTAATGKAYEGLTIAECREKLLADLTATGQLLDTKKIKHKVPIGERGKDIIEPLISEQWFINVDKEGNSLKRAALKKIQDGEINIYPERFKVLFEQWLENLRDWNISRQLWWGHQLPVWVEDSHAPVRASQPTTASYIVTTGEPPTNQKEGHTYTQEADTFDTWFSSGQWAFSTAVANGLLELDSECNTENKAGAGSKLAGTIKTDTVACDSATNTSPYFPTHTMVMGRDILFFWACRMLLLTVYRTGQVPWKNIFFTGLIRDEHGQKMSKSKGNGIEPAEMIKKYGADTLRLGLVMGATPGNDLSLSEKKFEGYNKFINKLWNAAKLIEMKLVSVSEDVKSKIDLKNTANNTFTAKLNSNLWVISEIEKLHQNVTNKLNAYEISIAVDEIYGFTWTKFCDWYLEILKINVDKGDDNQKIETLNTALYSFKRILILLQPFLPFITEEIYQKLPLVKSCDSLALEDWNYNLKINTEKFNPEIISRIDDVVSAVRSVKSALLINHKEINISLDFTPSAEEALLISELAKVKFVIATTISADLALKKPYPKGTIICEVENKHLYHDRLKKELDTNKNSIIAIEKKLTGDFMKFAKPEIVQAEKERLESAKNTVIELEKEISGW